ncbi:putative PurR-regulated permease PerM [Acinetobacter calcoaceticus]|uniref:Putative PurR-regulated permease PerM n=1 Tax=Acinetobacter calcoaceticus TaxID=471 RepID=A0A4R1Y2T7_ACICA|nr:putative PurR-regulated permease PerM [Acinetobacter calcoaceticus]
MKILNDRQSIIASYILMLLFLVTLIPLRLLACFFAGFVTYEIINSLGNYLEKYIGGQRARLSISIVLSIIVVTFLGVAISSLVSFVLYDLQGARGALMSHRVDLALQRLQLEIVQYIPSFIPYSLTEIKDHIFMLLKDNVSTLKHTGTDLLHNFATMIIGMIVAILVSLSQLNPTAHRPVFLRAIMQRINNLSTSFKNVVFAQIKISSINTLLFMVFAHAILPLFDVHLPFAKTLTILTFLFGLIPIVGNLVSNTLITLAGMTISMAVAVTSLSYLILIHKLEYFINAQIIGTKIRAKSWEVLLAMLACESIFGLGGLIVAPIFYAYLKLELKEAELI